MTAGPGPRRPVPSRYAYVASPLGRLLLTGDEEGLRGLFMEGSRDCPESLAGMREDGPWFRPAAVQLAAYFGGELQAFDMPLAPSGTPFQRDVWRALCDIPYGTTSTYAALAAAIGRPTAQRAVGAANGQNPIPIVIPCHRLVGSDGSLTGYGGGLWRKDWLLRHERACAEAGALG